jgi:hypothetical protein
MCPEANDIKFDEEMCGCDSFGQVESLLDSLPTGH